jgi:hypothetical protein
MVVDGFGQARVVIGPHGAEHEADVGHGDGPGGLEVAAGIQPEFAQDDGSGGKLGRQGEQAGCHERDAQLEHGLPLLADGLPVAWSLRARQAGGVVACHQDADGRGG